MKVIIAATLILLTRGGQLNITKDLSLDECKILMCHLRAQDSCLGYRCEGDRLIKNPGPDECVKYSDPTAIEHIECVE